MHTTNDIYTFENHLSINDLVLFQIHRITIMSAYNLHQQTRQKIEHSRKVIRLYKLPTQDPYPDFEVCVDFPLEKKIFS